MFDVNETKSRQPVINLLHFSYFVKLSTTNEYLLAILSQVDSYVRTSAILPRVSIRRTPVEAGPEGVRLKEL